MKKLILTLSISQLLIIQSSYANQGQYTLNCNISGASNPSQSQTGAPASRVRISSADAQHVCKKVLASLTSSQPAGSPQPAQAQTVTLGEISYNQIPEPKLRDLKQITTGPLLYLEMQQIHSPYPKSALFLNINSQNTMNFKGFT